jgi:hypothetical protein
LGYRGAASTRIDPQGRADASPSPWLDKPNGAIIQFRIGMQPLISLEREAYLGRERREAGGPGPVPAAIFSGPWGLLAAAINCPAVSLPIAARRDRPVKSQAIAWGHRGIRQECRGSPALCAVPPSPRPVAAQGTGPQVKARCPISRSSRCTARLRDGYFPGKRPTGPNLLLPRVLIGIDDVAGLVLRRPQDHLMAGIAELREIVAHDALELGEELP